METSNIILNTSALPQKSVFLWKQGVANGKAACILETLSDHGKVPLGIQEQILKQTSFSQLNRWFFLARQVRSVEEFMNRM